MAFSPTQSFSREPALRYGESILPWLRSFVKDGVLVNLPWAIVDSLYELGDADAFKVLLFADHVLSFESAPGTPGPFAHGVETPLYDPEAELARYEPTQKRPSVEAFRVLEEYCQENPYGWAELVKAVCEASYEDQRRIHALAVLKSGLRDSPNQIFRDIVEYFDDNEEWVRGFFTNYDLPTDLTPEPIVALFDEACQDAEAWPLFFGQEPDRAYHALRLFACRRKDADSWFSVLECLEGSSEERLYIRRYIVKSDGSYGLLRNVTFPHLSLTRVEPSGVTLKSPRGEFVLDAELAATLEPQRATAAEVRDMTFTLGVRAYLHEVGWPLLTVAETFEALGFEPDDYDVIVDSNDFEHVIGTSGVEYDPEGIDERWRGLPSSSETYRSLARALVARDRSLFERGTSNLDWRQHLDRANAARTTFASSPRA